MMNPFKSKKGLGRGLSSLIGDTNSKPVKNKVSIGSIIRNKFQPRKNFDKEKMEELTNSIQERGIIQPIIVRRSSEQVDKFEIIAGERRWQAAQSAGLHEVPIVEIEADKKIKNKIGIECLIETALGMSNIKEIAKASDRLEALHFGVADYAASLRARTVVIGGLNPDYPGDQWHHGLSELVMTCRAYGLRAIDGPFGDFNDPDAYISAARRGASIGIEGKWAIHPSQIELANKVFSPPEAEVNKAKRILEELDKAAKEGKGAAQLDGRMIDAASARMAENIVNIDKLIKG
jgi:citrate lyase beta subunit